MYEVIRYLSTWEVYNKKTRFTVMEHPFPYNESEALNSFFMEVHSCQSDEEVLGLYEQCKHEEALKCYEQFREMEEKKR